ncbi:MAG: glycosyl hydrolase family 28-related protein [Ginsengibacter sp.]
MKKIIFFILFLFSGNLSAQKTLKINVLDYGAKGDGVYNNYSSLQKVYDAINQNGGGEIFFPKGVYYLDSYHTADNNLPDLIIENCNYLKIYGDRAVISVKGNFKRNVTSSNAKNKMFSTDYAITPMIIKACKNVSIENLEIRGNVQQTTRDSSVVESGGRLIVIGNSDNVSLKNLYLHHAQTDGLYILGSNAFKADNVICSNNARQGMSIITMQNGTFNNCQFINTGITEGSYGHHGPSAGVDLEPNKKTQFVNNVVFSNCKFENNLGSQFIASNPATTENVTLNNCSIIAHQDSPNRTIIVNAKNVVFNNCTIDCKKGNIYPVWHKPGASSVFSNCVIKSEASGFVVVSNDPTQNVSIENCSIEYTGNTNLNSYFPYIQMENVNFTNNKITIPKEYYRLKGPSSLIQKARSVSNNTFISNGKSVTPPASFSGSTLK